MSREVMSTVESRGRLALMYRIGTEGVPFIGIGENLTFTDEWREKSKEVNEDNIFILREGPERFRDNPVSGMRFRFCEGGLENTSFICEVDGLDLDHLERLRGGGMSSMRVLELNPKLKELSGLSFMAEIAYGEYGKEVIVKRVMLPKDFKVDECVLKPGEIAWGESHEKMTETVVGLWQMLEIERVDEGWNNKVLDRIQDNVRNVGQKVELRNVDGKDLISGWVGEGEVWAGLLADKDGIDKVLEVEKEHEMMGVGEVRTEKFGHGGGEMSAGTSGDEVEFDEPTVGVVEVKDGNGRIVSRSVEGGASEVDAMMDSLVNEMRQEALSEAAGVAVMMPSDFRVPMMMEVMLLPSMGMDIELSGGSIRPLNPAEQREGYELELLKVRNLEGNLEISEGIVDESVMTMSVPPVFGVSDLMSQVTGGETDITQTSEIWEYLGSFFDTDDSVVDEAWFDDSGDGGGGGDEPDLSSPPSSPPGGRVVALESLVETDQTSKEVSVSYHGVSEVAEVSESIRNSGGGVMIEGVEEVDTSKAVVEYKEEVVGAQEQEITITEKKESETEVVVVDDGVTETPIPIFDISGFKEKVIADEIPEYDLDVLEMTELNWSMAGASLEWFSETNEEMNADESWVAAFTLFAVSSIFGEQIVVGKPALVRVGSDVVCSGEVLRARQILVS